MEKTKNKKLNLNAAEKKCLEIYANGEFAHLADIESKDSFKFQLAECGDGLLRFLMNELSSSEDCDNVETAVQRLERAIEDSDTPNPLKGMGF